VRHRDKLVLALRRPDGRIGLKTGPWQFLTRRSWRKQPLLRGVVLLAETLLNGFYALDLAKRAEGRRGPALVPALAMVFFLFAVLPHILAVLTASIIGWPGSGLGLSSMGFQALEGFCALAVLFGAAAMVFVLPSMRRLGQYHGAEHKIIRAWESGHGLDPDSSDGHSLGHPRCGTTFLALTVILAGLLNTLLGPLLMSVPAIAGSFWAGHFGTLALKAVLFAPAAGLAWEALRVAATHEDTLLAAILTAPGRALQLLTTREPDRGQLEVAAVALKAALGKNL
jgi:uncharacterized protein YqhQ